MDNGGVHHETARVACAIVADCRWDGWLSRSKDPNDRPTEGPDGVLMEPQYYFHVPDDPQYAVVPLFKHFRLRNGLPESWTAAPITDLNRTFSTVNHRDGGCLIAAWEKPTEKARMIPAALDKWWYDADMSDLSPSADAWPRSGILQNMISLRQDVHTLWDDHYFAIVSKNGKWVVHALGVHKRVHSELHNVELRPLRDVTRPYLLVRFALAILSSQLSLWDVPGGDATIKVVTADGPVNQTAHEMSRKDCDKKWGHQPNIRSASPKKRKATDEPNDGESDSEGSYMSSRDSYDDNDGDGEEWEEEQERGRPRKRLRRFDSPPPDR